MQILSSGFKFCFIKIYLALYLESKTKYFLDSITVFDN